MKVLIARLGDEVFGALTGAWAANPAAPRVSSITFANGHAIATFDNGATVDWGPVGAIGAVPVPVLAITASGTTAATAASLAAPFTIIVAGTGGVALTAQPGGSQGVLNATSAPVFVYPIMGVTGANINGQAVMQVAPGVEAVFRTPLGDGVNFYVEA